MVTDQLGCVGMQGSAMAAREQITDQHRPAQLLPAGGAIPDRTRFQHRANHNRTCTDSTGCTRRDKGTARWLELAQRLHGEPQSNARSGVACRAELWMMMQSVVWTDLSVNPDFVALRRRHAACGPVPYTGPRAGWPDDPPCAPSHWPAAPHSGSCHGCRPCPPRPAP